MNQKARIVVVDDDDEMRSMLKEFLEGQGYWVRIFPMARSAFSAFDQGELDDIDLVISDIKMPEMDGTKFAEKLGEIRPDVPVVLITAFGSIESAVQAIRSGVYDYVVKPFKLNELLLTVERAIEYRNLRKENQVLRSEVKRSWTRGDIIGKAPSMQRVFELIERVAGAVSNVMITGESGTGKEMVARAIHNHGPRSSEPFVAINCTAIPDSLLESELFGHAKGSFTGAHQDKKGLFEEANGGTLFLDEIGDMELSLQAKLLRAIQEKKIRAVGDNLDKEIDVRIITATHKDLKSAIREGAFREDLFYRLSVIPISIPPLRQRKEDVPILADFFLKKYAAANRVKIVGFTQSALSKLIEHRWEGNVRELENMIERSVVLCTKDRIDSEDLPLEAEPNSAEDFFNKSTNDYPTIAQLEERYIKYILEKTAGRKSKAAQILGINRRTLYRKQNEYGYDLGAQFTSDDDLSEETQQ